MGVSPATLALGAGERAAATVTVAVPGDAAAGERYAVVWAHQVAAGGGTVAQVGRVGVRVYLSVGAGGAPRPDFAIEAFTGRRLPDGRPVVQADVHNTGSRALELSGELELTGGPGGLSARPYPAEPGLTLAPGDHQPVIVALDPAIPAGPWDARLRLQSGPVERTGEARLELPAEPGTDGPTVPLGSTRSPVPAWLLAAAVLLAAAGTARTRRRRRAPGDGEDAPRDRVGPA